MDSLDQVLRDFEADVERAEHLLHLIKGFREFGASEIPITAISQPKAWPEADKLWEDSKKRRTDLPVLSGALLLYLAGRFEYFVRQTVETVALDMVDEVKSYVELPEALRNELSARTLEVVQNPRRFGFDQKEAETFLIGLAKNLNGDDNPLRISSAVLSITEANMKDRVLAELTKRVGMESVWKELGKQARLKTELGTSGDGETTSAAQTQLNKLMDDRNQIAHPTNSTTFPDPDQVIKNAAFLKIFAEEMAAVVRVYLNGFRTTAHANTE